MANIMTIRAPDELQNKLSSKAKELGITRNALVLVILNEWINPDNKKLQNQECVERKVMDHENR